MEIGKTIKIHTDMPRPIPITLPKPQEKPEERPIPVELPKRKIPVEVGK